MPVINLNSKIWFDTLGFGAIKIWKLNDGLEDKYFHKSNKNHWKAIKLMIQNIKKAGKCTFKGDYEEFIKKINKLIRNAN